MNHILGCSIILELDITLPAITALERSSRAQIIMDKGQPPEIPPNIIPQETIYDSGFVAWSQVGVSHLLVVNGFGYLSSFGLFQSHWESVLDRSSSDVSWVGSLQLFLLFFIGTLSGRAVDAGYFRSLIIIGCSMQLLGVFITSAINRYWQLVLSQGVLQGFGNGLLFTPLVALVSTYFVKKRTIALGLAACGAPVGGVLFPLVRSSPPLINILESY